MSKTKKQRLRKVAGWTCFALSTLSWALIFAIPWFSFEKPLTVVGVLYGMSYVFWFAALGCLGKAILTQSIHTLKQVGYQTIKRYSPRLSLRFSSLAEPEPHCEDDDV